MPESKNATLNALHLPTKNSREQLYQFDAARRAEKIKRQKDFLRKVEFAVQAYRDGEAELRSMQSRLDDMQSTLLSLRNQHSRERY